MDPGALGGLCGCPCLQGLEGRQCHETAPHRQNPQHRSVQAVPGEDLGTGARGISRGSAHSAPPSPKSTWKTLRGAFTYSRDHTQKPHRRPKDDPLLCRETGSLRHKYITCRHIKHCDLLLLHISTPIILMRISQIRQERRKPEANLLYI